MVKHAKFSDKGRNVEKGKDHKHNHFMKIS